jgi:hypothetical protein
MKRSQAKHPPWFGNKKTGSGLWAKDPPGCGKQEDQGSGLYENYIAHGEGKWALCPT